MHLHFESLLYFRLDQCLYEATLLRPSAKEWTAYLKEIQLQYYFLFGLVLMKRAQKV